MSGVWAEMEQKARADLGPAEVEEGEKATLLSFLDYLREAVVAKTAGVPEPEARAAGSPFAA